MSNDQGGFGASQEVQEGPVVKYYTGVENFKVVAVNPSKEELETIYGRELNFTPEYLGETEVEDGDGKRTVPQYRIDLYLANEDDSITTKVQYYIADTHHLSATNKYKVINSFGKATWLTQEDIQNKTLPENMQWFNATGIKIAKRGEEYLVDCLVNLLNLPFKIDELVDPSEAFASINAAQWANIFKGDVSLIQGIINNTNNKVGFLLGVKTKADGKLVQTVYNRKPLRQFTKSSTRANKYDYLRKDLLASTNAGAFGNVDFGVDPGTAQGSLEVSEFVVGATAISSDNTNQTDIFATDSGAQDEFNTTGGNSWMDA
mgnify:CR=1 FL=1